MLVTDKYAYSSKLAKKDPLAKVIFTFTMLFLCLILNNVFVSIFILIFFAGFTIISNPAVSFIKYIKFMLIPFSFLIMGIIPVLITFVKGDSIIILIDRFNIGITDNSLHTSINLFFRALSAVSITYFLALSTPMTCFFESLYKLKLPKLFISLMELIYRYIFILIDEAAAMYNAQKLRLGYSSFKSSLQCVSSLAAMLFIRAYKRADFSYQALLSRGYDGEITTINNEYERAYIFYILMFFIAGLCIILKAVL